MFFDSARASAAALRQQRLIEIPKELGMHSLNRSLTLLLEIKRLSNAHSQLKLRYKKDPNFKQGEEEGGKSANNIIFFY